MKIEEANSCIETIEMLQELAYNIHGVMDVIDANNCKKIIKTLEQESCEDCVSREQALLTLTGKNLSTKSIGELIVLFNKRIKALPPVIPTRKKGKWKDSVYSLGFTCTCCLTTQTSGCRYKFCPNCGAKMEEE